MLISNENIHSSISIWKVAALKKQAEFLARKGHSFCQSRKVSKPLLGAIIKFGVKILYVLHKDYRTDVRKVQYYSVPFSRNNLAMNNKHISANLSAM